MANRGLRRRLTVGKMNGGQYIAWEHVPEACWTFHAVSSNECGTATKIKEMYFICIAGVAQNRQHVLKMNYCLQTQYNRF